MDSLLQNVFLFRHRISELRRRPIAVKLCHMIGIWLNFIIQNAIPKIGGCPLKKFGAKNMQNLGRYHTTPSLIANISPERIKIPENRKANWSRTIPPAFDKRSPVYYRSIIQKVVHVNLDPLTSTFRETIFRPSGGAAPSNFCTPYNPINCITGPTFGAGRPHTGLCPIFLVKIRRQSLKTTKSVVSVGEFCYCQSDNFFAFSANVAKLVQILLLL